MKMLHDRVSKLEFELPRVQVLVDGVPTMLVESMARDLKLLRMELDNAVSQNNELEGRLAGLRVEINKMKGEVEAMKLVMKKTSDDEGEIDEPKRDNILSVSYIYNRYSQMLMPREGR